MAGRCLKSFYPKNAGCDSTCWHRVSVSRDSAVRSLACLIGVIVPHHLTVRPVSQDTSEVGKAGQIVHKTFFELIDKHMPAYSRYIHQNDPVEPDSRLEHDRKRCRSSTSPVSAADANGKPEEILHHPA